MLCGWQVVWAQEEPQNQGAWHHVDPRIETALRETENHVAAAPTYAGRPATASTATGHKYAHIDELHSLLADALLPKGMPAEKEKVEGGFPKWRK